MNKEDQFSLSQIAHQAMIERGFYPDFSNAALNELQNLHPTSNENVRDMRNLWWLSIDNDDSRDLDQLTYAEEDRIFVAVADVDSLVKKQSAIDLRASHNTTSVYTPTRIFPMLPDKLSTDLTSLNEHEDRYAIVIEIRVEENGAFSLVDLYRALVRNQAKLAYNGVTAFLEKKAPLSKEIPGLNAQLQLQDKMAQKIQKYRNEQGALGFAKNELEPVIVDDIAIGLKEKVLGRANSLIENFMIAANVGMSRFFTLHKIPTLRRIVRTPQRWDRIVALAKELDGNLPADPDAKALRNFLLAQQKRNPEGFADLSLSIIKLIGRGEYVLGMPDTPPEGHFNLALIEYAHTTAPNRRFPDLIMQRMLKAHLTHKPMPYEVEELAFLANYCTEKEDDAARVERRVMKSAAAMVLAPQIGHTFKAMVTGVTEIGTWVRIFAPPVEGKLVQGYKGLDVGDKINVKLAGVDIPLGHIDFWKI